MRIENFNTYFIRPRLISPVRQHITPHNNGNKEALSLVHKNQHQHYKYTLKFTKQITKMLIFKHIKTQGIEKVFQNENLLKNFLSKVLLF